ncbi:MAG: hypothetical protein QG602_2063 [Verrucomicrobiota bacterium]|nr:hypothetical protein [Verrucomicrobiota bacterium]
MSAVTVSYDVFDTVVTRAFAHPRDLFVQVGVRLKKQGLVAGDEFSFARARWAAELGARKKSPWTEVLLDDIYRELTALLSWDKATAAIAQRTELEVESRHLHGIPITREQLARDRTEAGRLLFLSDMYLPAAILRPWLEREGVVTADDLLLISGEVRGNKSSGQLFAIAQQQTGGDFTRWRHAGDHPFADVAKPRELGITVTHFTAAHLTGRERRTRGTEGEFAQPWRSLLAGAMRLARLERAPAGERDAVLWETGATVAGPLFYGFVRWTLGEARRRGLRRLYFLARDGQIFHRIAQAVQAVEPHGVECHYLHASRVLFSGPAEIGSVEAVRAIVAPHAVFHSLRQCLLPLGLDEAWAAAHLPERFRSFEPTANLPQVEREALADWLTAPERGAADEAALARRIREGRAYLQSVGLVAGAPVGLVDAGWFGTIQRNLEHILGGPAGPAPLTGFYLGLMPAGDRPFAGEAFAYTNHFAPLPLLREESHKVLIELMAQADHGQAAGFELRDGRWTVRLQDTGPVDLAAVRLFQEAVLAFVGRMLAIQSEAEAPEEAFARAVIGIYRHLHDRPTAREARVLGFLPHSDQYFEQRHAGLCADLNLREMLTALRDYQRRPPHWWVQGQAALGHAAWLHLFHTFKRWRWKLAGRPE